MLTQTFLPPIAPLAGATPSTEPLMRFRGIDITETASFPPAPARQCWVYVTVNAEVALTTPHDAHLQSLLHSPRARVSVDGQWIWWALRRKYAERPLKKMAGSDLIHDLGKHCALSGRRLLLVGSTLTSNTEAVKRLAERWPGLQVAGVSPGQFEPDSAAEQQALNAVVEAAAEHRPHYVVLGLGPAKQFRFAQALAARLDGIADGLLCFGGSIDMVSGQVRRASVRWQRCGLEGIYRILQQPSRLPRFLRLLPIVPIVAFGRY